MAHKLEINGKLVLKLANGCMVYPGSLSKTDILLWKTKDQGIDFGGRVGHLPRVNKFGSCCALALGFPGLKALLKRMI